MPGIDIIILKSESDSLSDQVFDLSEYQNGRSLSFKYQI